MIVLSDERERELVEALAEAFAPEDLDFKIADPLGVPREARSGARDVRERVRALIAWARDGQQLGKLLTVAHNGNPSSTRLRRFMESAGMLAATGSFHDVLDRALSPADIETWMRGLVAAQRQVCRVEIVAAWSATGFLVGDDQVMTFDMTSDVIEHVRRGEAVCHFDDTSVPVHAISPIVVAEGLACVLRLSRPIARVVEHGRANVAARARGWITPTSDGALRAPLTIVQFLPEGIRVAVDPLSAGQADGTAVYYSVSTLAGASGAPCFDAAWNLVAIHAGHDATRNTNYGYSTASVVSALERQGYRWDASFGIRPIAAPEREDPAPAALDELIAGIASEVHGADIWRDDVEDLNLPDADRWAWVEAAAVHATYDPETLQPFGTGSTGARVALLLESRQVGGRWLLGEKLRRHALQRLGARGALSAARAANPADEDRLDATFAALIAGKAPTTRDLRDPDALRALITATGWLAGAMPGLPDISTLRAALERAMLLAPFRHLTRGFFAGRALELLQLERYVDRSFGDPLFIHAAGGMGKSALLAHFVLANAERDAMDPASWRPFVYLDFDRPDLDASDLAGILLAIIRQLGAQIPALAEPAQQLIRDAQQRQRAARVKRVSNRPEGLASQIAPGQWRNMLEDATQMLGALPAHPPVVLILDTLEEVQFATPDAIDPLIDLVDMLCSRAPLLRPIFAGRVAATQGVEHMQLLGLPRDACETLLQNELPAAVAGNTGLVSRLVEVVGHVGDDRQLRANPLSLKLAAQVIKREAARADRVIDELDEALENLVSDQLVQGRLYERVLGHVHDKRVERIAHPGLVLRRITPALIRDVLAVPCGLGDVDDTTAQQLFEALAREVALVTQVRDAYQQANPSELALRPELRRVVRDDLARDRNPERVAQRAAIHANAIAYYGRSSEPRDRAEEIYHRLAAGEYPDDVDRRWMTGIEAFLRDAVGDLPPAANAYLANRVGGVADEAQIAMAAPTDWEIYAAKRAGDLLKFGQAQKALDLLATRRERLPASKLHYIESIARRSLAEPDLEGAEAAAERAVDAARAGGNSDDLRFALDELLLVRRLRRDSAGALRVLADLGDLGEMLGDDLVVLRTSVESLESASAGSREMFTQAAMQVFNRLPDELLAKVPELSRRMAAQVGGSDVSTLQRVISTVGPGALDGTEAQSLQQVLEGWKTRVPEIAPYVPIGTVSAKEIASATRHLVGRYEMDGQTARELSSWLGSVVTPKSLL